MRQVVASVDHQIRLQGTQSGEPALASSRLRRHMQIGYMEYANVSGTRRQHRHRHTTYSEGVDLIQPCVRQTAGADRATPAKPLTIEAIAPRFPDINRRLQA